LPRSDKNRASLSRPRHARSPDANPVDDGSRPPATWGKSPRESDMSMNDLAIIAGAIVVLALIGFVFYKRVIKN